MSIQYPDFVGRNEVMGLIDQQVERWGEKVIVNIVGAGGVGKTTILHELQRLYTRPGTLVTGVIDFSQTVHRVQSWVLGQIVNIKRSGFTKLPAKLKAIESADPLTRLQLEEDAIETFVMEYNHLAQTDRMILLFDTIEYIQDTPLLAHIIRLAARLENTVFVLTGRRNNEEEVTCELNAHYKQSQILPLELEGFSEIEAQIYMAETKIPVSINDTLQKNIYLLSDKNPIKIALALDWLNRGIPLMPEVTAMTPDEITGASDLKFLKQEFEYALMSGIRGLDEPVDEVVLYMAHLHKRFNLEMVEFFFLQHLEDQQSRRAAAVELVAQLRKLPFVKYVSDRYFVLHDEMARMVVEHVWDSVEDPDKNQRRNLSREAVTYYDTALENLPPAGRRGESERIEAWSYQVEQVYYQLYANFETGYQAFERLFDQLTGTRRSELAALSVSFLREFKKEPDYSKLLKCFVEGFYTGGVLLSREEADAAKAIIVPTEQRLREIIADLDLEHASSLDRHLHKRRYTIYNQLGFCYRSLGDWKQASKNYHKSLDLALEMIKEKEIPSPTGTQDDDFKTLMAQIAVTLNNLANVHRFEGAFFEARLLCQTSILIRQTWQQDQVAASQYVMAMILWEMGNTTESMSYLRKAEKSCPPENEILKALIQKYRAYIYFHAGLPERSLPLLEEAEAVFRRRARLSDTADALNLRSRIYRDYPTLMPEAADNHMPTIINLTSEALDIAVRSRDEFRQTECYLTSAIHYLHWARLNPDRGKFFRDCALEQWQIGNELSKERYFQLWSLYCQVRGDIAFESEERKDKNYREAFENYIQQCKLATRFKRAVYERAVDRLAERLTDLAEYDPSLAERHISDAIYVWHRDPLLRADQPASVPFESRALRFPEFVDELTRIRDEIDRSRRLEAFDNDYNRAMRRGDWREAIEFGDKMLVLLAHNDQKRAGVYLEQFRAAYQLGDMSLARKMARIALYIGQELDNPELTGEARLAMSMVLWDTTNTSEAAAILAKAEESFRTMNHKLGIIHVKQLRSHILYRVGLVKESLRELKRIAQSLERNNQDADLAGVWNLMSRISHAHPHKSTRKKAVEYAQKALEKALLAEDHYRQAECNLTLAVLAFDAGQYNEVLKTTRKVLAWLSPQTHLLRAMYHGIQGAAHFEQALANTDAFNRSHHLDQAFESFGIELAEATKAKPATLPRVLDSLFDYLMRIEFQEVPKYAEQVKGIWRQKHVEADYRIIARVCEEAIQFRPYIELNQSAGGR